MYSYVAIAMYRIPVMQIVRGGKFSRLQSVVKI